MERKEYRLNPLVMEGIHEKNKILERDQLMEIKGPITCSFQQHKVAVKLAVLPLGNILLFFSVS